MSIEFYWLAVVAATIISSARITRLAVYDKFPPAQWVRDKYLDANDGNGWALLALCGYCMSFWITLLIVGWGLLSDVYGSGVENPEHPVAFVVWWIVNGIFAMSYLAAAFVANDGDDSEDED